MRPISVKIDITAKLYSHSVTKKNTWEIFSITDMICEKNFIQKICSETQCVVMMARKREEIEDVVAVVS